MIINGKFRSPEQIMEMANYSVRTVLGESQFPLTTVEIAQKAGMAIHAAEEVILRLHATGELLHLESIPVMWVLPK